MFSLRTTGSWISAATASLFVLGGLTMASLLAPSLPVSPLHDSGSSVASAQRAALDTLRAVSQHVVRKTNEVRRERDLSPLQTDKTLAEIACAHNADMFRRAFFEHVNPDGESPHDRVAQMHRRLVGGVSENLYKQDRIRKGPAALGAQMVEKWMGSPPHRKNILFPSATHLGVCVTRKGSTLRGTQLFAKVVGYLAPPLPRTAAPGSTLAISFEQTFPSGTIIARYDFWDPRTERRIFGPTLFVDTLRLPDTTGTVHPRFHTVGTDEYVIYRGPDITIVDAPTSPSQ